MIQPVLNPVVPAAEITAPMLAMKVVQVLAQKIAPAVVRQPVHLIALESVKEDAKEVVMALAPENVTVLVHQLR